MHELPLDLIGVLFGTDKSVLGNDYLRLYERAFSKFRDLPINLIEIGVFQGASVKMWRKYFRSAQIVGIDNRPECRKFEDHRIAIEIGSQDDRKFLEAVVQRYPPTIIIDDGSHMADHIIYSFEAMFPHLLPGGCYAAEDLHFHNGPNAEVTRGSAPLGAHEYFLRLARTVIDRQANDLAELNIPRGIYQQVDRVEAVAKAAFIWKRDPGEEVVDQEFVEFLAERTDLPKNWLLLATYNEGISGPVEKSERALKIVNEREPGNWGHQYFFARVLHRKRDFAGAMAWLDEARKTAPPHIQPRLLQLAETLKKDL